MFSFSPFKNNQNSQKQSAGQEEKLQTPDLEEGERGEIYSLILVDWAVVVQLNVSLLHGSNLFSKRHHLHFS